MSIQKIRTGFYSDTALAIFEAFADSWRYAAKYYTFHVSKPDRTTFANMVFSRDPSGEIVITSYGTSGTHFNKWRNNDEACDWIAWHLKCVTYKGFERAGDKKHDNWDRSNIAVADTIDSAFKRLANSLGIRTEKDRFELHMRENVRGISIPYFDVTVKHVYAMYDVLRRRKNIERKYDEAFLSAIIGTEADPFTTEQETIRRETIAQLQADLKSEKARLNKERDDVKYKEVVRIDAEYNQKVLDAEDETQRKINELNERFKRAREESAKAAAEIAAADEVEELEDLSEVSDLSLDI